MRIGFVGTGTMGPSIAVHMLAAGNDLTFLRRRSTPANHMVVAAGGVAVGQLAEVVKGAEAIVLMLPGSPEVEAVLADPGLREGLAPGTIVIDCSTSDPASTSGIASDLGSIEVALCDAPIVRGQAGARDGTLAFYMGGSENDVARARKVLAPCGTDFVHVGDAGAGHTAKVLNNAVSITTLAVLAEAFGIARSQGIPPDRRFDVLTLSNAESASLRQYRPMLLGTPRKDVSFRLDLALKDLRLAETIALSPGAYGPIWGATESLQRAVADGLGMQDVTDLIYRGG
jgi:3-hydroxyisobutyrate dehydrogenase-like beta-hydroxyacid dehydrogenase